MRGKFLLDEYPLIIIPSLAEAIGLNKAIILQQLHYWLEKSNNVINGERWVYNTYEDWQEQLPFWSLSTVRRAISELEKDNLIITGNFNKAKMDKTKWYRIDYEMFDQLLNSRSVQNEQSSDQIEQTTSQDEQSNCSNRAMEEVNLNKAIPDNTTEITTEIKKEEEKDKPNPFSFYEQNGFGMLGGYLVEKINYWLDGDFFDDPEVMVIEALKISIENNVKTWKYTETILSDWTSKKARNFNDVQALIASHKDKMSRKNKNQYSKLKQKNENLPKWMTDPEKASSENKATKADLEKSKQNFEERLKLLKEQKEKKNAMSGS